MNIKSLLIAAVSAVFVLTSCDQTTEETGPTLTITPADTTLSAGDSITFAYTISSDQVIASLIATPDNQNMAAQTVTSFNGSYLAEGTMNFVVDAAAAEGSIIHINFVALDATAADSAMAMITVGAPAAQDTLEEEVTGALIWNLQGPYKGAWDLVADDSLSSVMPDSLKDMSNLTTFTDVVDASLEGGFRAGWESKNGTMFVVDADFDYHNATLEAAMASYAAGTASETVDSVALGDVVVAKLRGGSDYTVIQITNIITTDGDNLDRIEFTYKRNM